MVMLMVIVMVVVMVDTQQVGVDRGAFVREDRRRRASPTMRSYEVRRGVGGGWQRFQRGWVGWGWQMWQRWVVTNEHRGRRATSGARWWTRRVRLKLRTLRTEHGRIRANTVLSQGRPRLVGWDWRPRSRARTWERVVGRRGAPSAPLTGLARSAPALLGCANLSRARLC